MSGNFVGRNAVEARELLVASAVVHAHTVLIGEPGCGKTVICRAVANKIYANQHVFIRLNASTPPEKVEGLPDPVAALQRGEYVLVVHGTAYDPVALAIIADEIGRPMDQIFEIFLDIMDRQDTDADKSPVVWGTANFLPTSERTEAFRDRFTFRYWYKKEPLDIKATVRNQMLAIGGHLEVTNHMPTPQEIEGVYNARPGDKAIEAVTNVIERLVREANQSKGNFRFNVESYRRLTQWDNMLFRMGYYLTGDEDFSVVPAGAVKMLNWAYPNESLEQQTQWQSIIQSIADPLEAALSTLRTNAYRNFQSISEKKAPLNEKALDLGLAMADAQKELWTAARAMTAERDDNGQPVITDESKQKVEDAINELQRSYAKMIKGENPLG